MNESKCPVPKEQQPTNEFIELSKSIIFSLPKTKKTLILALIKFWLGAFVLFLVISSGSIYFKTSILKYFLLSLFSSLSIPLLITIRLYLGWNHIFKRLTSERVEYEESGWYDGQIWIKPLVLKEKESLIASIEAISDSFSFRVNGFIHTRPSYQPDSSYSTFSEVNLLKI